MSLTQKQVRAALEATGQPIRHNVAALAKASKRVAKAYDCDPEAVFRFMCFNEPIPGVWTHSYGFHTREGREMRDSFSDYYNNFSV